MAKFKSKTLSTYRAWQGAKVALYAGMWALPVAPATVMTAINWDDWFAEAGSSLPFGFISLIVTTLLGIVGIWKKDELVNKKVSAIFYVALIFACLGATNLFLASLFSTVGYMFLMTAGGLVASATCDQVSKTLVDSRIKEYRELIETNALDSRTKKRNERKERARAEALAEAKAMQATE